MGGDGLGDGRKVGETKRRQERQRHVEWVVVAAVTWVDAAARCMCMVTVVAKGLLVPVVARNLC